MKPNIVQLDEVDKKHLQTRLAWLQNVAGPFLFFLLGPAPFTVPIVPIDPRKVTQHHDEGDDHDHVDPPLYYQDTTMRLPGDHPPGDQQKTAA